MQPQDSNEGRNYDNERKIYEAFHVPKKPRSSFYKQDVIQGKYDAIRVPTQLTKEDFWKFLTIVLALVKSRWISIVNYTAKLMIRRYGLFLMRCNKDSTLSEKIYSQNQDSSAQVHSKLTKRGRLNCHWGKMIFIIHFYL